MSYPRLAEAARRNLAPGRDDPDQHTAALQALMNFVEPSPHHSAVFASPQAWQHQLECNFKLCPLSRKEGAEEYARRCPNLRGPRPSAPRPRR
jgi:hypothetical protein